MLSQIKRALQEEEQERAGGVGQCGRGEEKNKSSQKKVHHVQPGEKLLRHLIRRMQTKPFCRGPNESLLLASHRSGGGRISIVTIETIPVVSRGVPE